MSFGFSAGDFIAALSLVGTVISAIRETGGSKSEYQELVHELYSLETALLRVKQLELEEEQRSEYLSLRYAAAQCQQTIDGFWKKTQKYQKHLKNEGSGSHTKDCWMKIKWNLCKKDDIVSFKGDVTAHVQSIHILLTALQMVCILSRRSILSQLITSRINSSLIMVKGRESTRHWQARSSNSRQDI
jgi:hypothetical protein